eukprot:gene13727-13849_t
MLLTSLLPTTHLAADLHSKLKLLVNKARRPAGLMGPPAPVTAAPSLPASLAAACGSSRAVGAATAGPAGSGAGARTPPCLQTVTLQQLVQQVVCLLPSLQQHMNTALTVIREPSAGGSKDWLFKGCSKELPILTVAKVLAALAGQSGTAAAGDPQQIQALVIAAFKSSKKLSCRSSGSSNLQLELAVLGLWQAIATLAAAQDVASAKQAAISNVLATAAEGLLKESWLTNEDEAEDEGSKGFTWKGQSAAITQLLTVLVSSSAEPSAKLLALGTEVLAEVPAKTPAKQQLDPIAGFAALCSATFLTWYKVLFEQLVVQWDKLTRQGMALLAAVSHDDTAMQGTVRQQQGRSRRPQQPPLNSQGLPDWDDHQVDAILAQAGQCAAVFANLFSLAKVHQTRNGLLGNAVKLGGSFIDGLLRAMPLWRALFHNGRDAQFLALIKDVQKGTKVMQTICNEAKARRAAGALLARAPAAKRSLERFLFEMMAFFNAAGAAQAFKVGTLKHRDLDGNVVGSQICPPEEEGEDEDDEGDEEEEEDAAGPEEEDG